MKLPWRFRKQVNCNQRRKKCSLNNSMIHFEMIVNRHLSMFVNVMANGGNNFRAIRYICSIVVYQNTSHKAQLWLISTIWHKSCDSDKYLKINKSCLLPSIRKSINKLFRNNVLKTITKVQQVASRFRVITDPIARPFDYCGFVKLRSPFTINVRPP